MICFYYGLTAFACVWYFRSELFTNVRDFVFKGLFPGLGGIMLALVFLKTCVDTWDPAYGAGGAIFGIGTVFVIGVGILLLGVVLMFVWQSPSSRRFSAERPSGTTRPCSRPRRICWRAETRRRTEMGQSTEPYQRIRRRSGTRSTR